MDAAKFARYRSLHPRDDKRKLIEALRGVMEAVRDGYLTANGSMGQQHVDCLTRVREVLASVGAD